MISIGELKLLTGATRGDRDCLDCPHLSRQTESWEMPHIWWYECTQKEHVQNLKSFPFKNTRCKYHPKNIELTEVK